MEEELDVVTNDTEIAPSAAPSASSSAAASGATPTPSAAPSVTPLPAFEANEPRNPPVIETTDGAEEKITAPTLDEEEKS